MKFLELKLPPPLVALLIAAGMWQLASIGPSLGPGAGWHAALTAALAGAGGTFDLLGLLTFLKSKTTVNSWTPHKTSALVTCGVYRITRNPMYVGLVLLLAAWAIFLTGAWSFLGPPLFIVYINRFQIEPEERALARTFGPAYTAYATRVRRWL